ncbi:ribonuclease R [Mesorhizobium sp. J428]|uniref:ribonuclease R n=1 Tax=Mesorhizobium sp. J428 TaxID=2898440 RepID=UPI0035ADC1B5
MARRLPGSGKAGKRRGGQDSASAEVGEDGFPTRQALLDYIQSNPDLASKRDIAKAFGLKGEGRIWLKQTLAELASEGLLDVERKSYSRPGALPPVVALEIFGRDREGGLLARPVEQPEDADPVLVSIRSPRGARAPTAGVGDRVLAKVFPAKERPGPAYTGRVIRLIDHRKDLALGVLRKLADGSFRLEPVERRQPELMIDADALGDAKPGDLVEAEQVSSGRYGLPRGKVVAVLGSLDSEKAVSMIAIHAHDIPHVFPPQVLAEADAMKPAGMEHREDWRRLPLVTIDPADAKDHDDAVHAEPDTDPANTGGVIATVAIADVATYIRAGSPLDREALKRGNSVYFPDRVVPMLPERISNDLCSLREGEDRPALAVRMTFAADGRKIRHSFHRVMMKSAAKLAYPQAQAAIDGRPDDKTGPLLDTVLRPLWDAYAVLKRGRESRHPLELDLPERKILLKPDGTVDRVTVPERLDAHKLIEEFMIQANVAAAETLENKRQALIYRIHDAPSLAKQEALREFLRTLSISLARGAQLRPAQFNGILAQVRDTEHESLVNEVVLRSQSQAVYSPDNIGHFGLNLRRYAHFTSPIRRYADLIVHRALIGSLGLGAGGLTRDEEARLEEISALISASERRAMAAERDTVDRLIAAHLSGRKGETFEGRITGVTKSGLFVQLPTYGADGFVPVSTLHDDYYIYDETAHTLFGDRSGRGYRLGDAVEVKLVEVAPLAGSMRFEMLSDPVALQGMRQSFHKARGRRTARAGGNRLGGRSRRR